MTPKGIAAHLTGANTPTLKIYVDAPKNSWVRLKNNCIKNYDIEDITMSINKSVRSICCFMKSTSYNTVI